MSRRRAFRSILTLSAAVTGFAVAQGLPAAGAATGSPPVTAPDAVTLLQANTALVMPLNNDHDPDNELVALCRLGTEHYKGVAVDFSGDELAVYAKPHVTPGTYTFTYYACDYSYLVPGTVTVTVQALPKIPVTKVASRPGTLRVTNPTEHAMRFLYGSLAEEAPDGSVLIATGDTVTIPVGRTHIDWIATNRNGGVYLGTGHVDGIRMHRVAGGAAARVPLSGRLADLWRTTAGS